MIQDRPLFGFIRPPAPGARSRAELRCRVLEVMAASVARDVPLSPVIAAAATEHRGFARRALSELQLLLDEGGRLGAALSSCKLLAFPEHVVAAVDAADGSPRLATALAAAAADDAQAANRRAEAWTKCVYPLVVVAVVGAFAGGFLGATRQRMLEVFESMETEPTSSFEIAATAGRVAGWVALAAATVLVGAWLVRRSPAAARAVGATIRPLWQTTPGVRGAARLGAAADLLRALDPCLRAEMPLEGALRRAAPAAGCRAVAKSALAAADRAARGEPGDDVAAALLLPKGVRARFVLAASRAPSAFADAVRALAEECAERYRGALDVRARMLHLAATTLVGALVLTQLLGIFTMLEAVRRGISPW